MKYSIFFLICFLFLGCAAPKLSKEMENEAGLLQTRNFILRYGEDSDPRNADYFLYLENRLIGSYPKLAALASESPFTFILLNTELPMAFCPGGHFILVSKGLAARFENEAELAFVLSHELAHQYLEHPSENVDEFKNSESSSRRKNLEIEADKFGAGLMAVAGYDPRYSISSLIHAYGRSSNSTLTEDYPELNDRITFLRNQIALSGWRPPGTVDRRAFQQFRRRLIAENY